jgi:ABC-type multidrug transport system permease subunit
MNQVRWYHKLGSAKALTFVRTLFIASILVEMLAIRSWHNEVVAWIAVFIMFVTVLVVTIAWVRRVRES